MIQLLNLSVFWQSQINKLKFSNSLSLSFKMRPSLATSFCSDIIKINFKQGTRNGKHNDVKKLNFSKSKTKTIYKIRIMSEKRYIYIDYNIFFYPSPDLSPSRPYQPKHVKLNSKYTSPNENFEYCYPLIHLPFLSVFLHQGALDPLSFCLTLSATLVLPSTAVAPP